MNNVGSPGPVSLPSGGRKPANVAILFQILALLLSVPALIWGGGCVWDLATSVAPGDIEKSILVLGTWVVSAPIGLAVLAIGLFVKKGSPRLRRMCIIVSLVALSLPIMVNLLFSKAKDIKAQTEIIVQEGGVLTSKPLILMAKTQSGSSHLLFAGHDTGNPPPSILEIYTGPITYSEGFRVNVYMDMEDGDGRTSTKDANLIGSFALPPDDRRRNEATEEDRSVPFPLMVGSAFYKLIQPKKPFSVLLLPVGRAAADPNFRIPVKRIELTAFGGSWGYRFLRALPR